jgi:hypothetical protein
MAMWPVKGPQAVGRIDEGERHPRVARGPECLEPGQSFLRVSLLVALPQPDVAREEGVRFYNRRGTADIAHPHYTSSARWCSDPNPDYNPCVGVA